MRLSLPVILFAVALVMAGCATDRAVPHTGRGQVAVTTKQHPRECIDYDKAFVASVQNRWFDLLDASPSQDFLPGKIVVSFQLHADGSVTAVRLVRNATSERLGLLCEKAILDCAPYPVWPASMREVIQKEYREIEFAFSLN